ncbi:transmembrane protein, putative [Medicago truncatula]|uniref:Transmembrane protein, putative n=1 Tax=Medicago truncatula TaxID=3880 RepID=A0A072TRP9_MEDTR|nr:transmembrane protein, putative [Medicago truncatula]
MDLEIIQQTLAAGTDPNEKAPDLFTPYVMMKQKKQLIKLNSYNTQFILGPLFFTFSYFFFLYSCLLPQSHISESSDKMEGQLKITAAACVVVVADIRVRR